MTIYNTKILSQVYNVVRFVPPDLSSNNIWLITKLVILSAKYHR